MQARFEHEGKYPFLLQELPAPLKEELQLLKNFFSPYTKRIYMVGGSVRDLVRRYFNEEVEPIKDLDIEVFGIKPELFAKLMEKLGAKGVGKSFFVYKYRHNIDIALPRVEKKVAKGHRGFAVALAKEEREASHRRDFRLNALMLDIFDGKLLDFWGGIEDIAAKRIAIIDQERFKEDSLRVLRGMQFAARFGYRIDLKSCKVMQQMDLSDLSKERIFWEFEKMFKAKYLHFGLYYLLSLEIAKKIFKISPKRSFFFKTALEMKKAQKNFYEPLRKFYFLYIFAKNLHKNFFYFLSILQTPREYYKIFKSQKAVPKRRTDRFLAALALHLPIKEYLGNYKQDVTIRAKKFGFWDQKFVPVSAKELLAQGYRGKELGEMLRKRSLEIVKKRFRCEVTEF